VSIKVTEQTVSRWMAGEKPRALLAPSSYDACFYYRTLLLGMVLSRCGWNVLITEKLDSELLSRAHVVSFTRQHGAHALEAADFALTHGAKVVWDIDDLYWKVPAWSPVAKNFTSDVIAGLDAFVKKASVVTASTLQLQTLLASRAAREVAVLPNFVFPPHYDGDKGPVTQGGFGIALAPEI